MQSILLKENRKLRNSGQTLIETIVAIAILTTGIIGGLALAIQSLSSSERSSNEIIATNLAREGAEVVRQVRDSNWLDNNLRSCNYIENGQECVREWADFGGAICDCGFLTQCNGFPLAPDFNGTAGLPIICRNYRVEFNPSNGNITMDNRGGFSAGEYLLYKHESGAYNHSSSGGQATDFYRRVRIFREDDSPFSFQNFRIRVESVAWWQGRNCGNVTSENINTSCKVVVEEYLTNWKNY